VLIAAEFGSLHKQSIALAAVMIKEAKQAGADIAKFQLGWPVEDKVRHVGRDMAVRLWELCNFYGIEFMASIWSPEGLEIARELGTRRYKVSHQITREHPAWLDDLLEDEKETFVSGLPIYRPNVRRIFVSEEYPLLPDRVLLPSRFGDKGNYWGYSDHTLGIGACLAAIARGAMYVEKHFALDKTDMFTRDAPMSATPGELADLCRLGKEMEGM